MKQGIFIITFMTACFTFGGVAYAQDLNAFGLPAENASKSIISA